MQELDRRELSTEGAMDVETSEGLDDQENQDPNSAEELPRAQEKQGTSINPASKASRNALGRRTALAQVLKVRNKLLCSPSCPSPQSCQIQIRQIKHCYRNACCSYIPHKKEDAHHSKAKTTQ